MNAIDHVETLLLQLQDLLRAYVQTHDAGEIGLDECECELCRQARPLLK